MRSLLKVLLILLALTLAENSTAQLTEDLLVKQLIIESRNSHFDAKGNIWVSSAGALGIAQFMPETWDWLKYKRMIPSHYTITSEEHQREAHKVFMSYLFEYNYGVAFDQESLAFASYNAGIHRVKRLVQKYGESWRTYLPKETRLYLISLNL